MPANNYEQIFIDRLKAVKSDDDFDKLLTDYKMTEKELSDRIDSNPELQGIIPAGMFGLDNYWSKKTNIFGDAADYVAKLLKTDTPGQIDGKDFDEFGQKTDTGKSEAELEDTSAKGVEDENLETIYGYPEVVNAEDTRDYSYKGPYQSRGLGGNRGADGSLLPGQQKQTVDEDMAVSEDMSPFGPGYYKQEGQNFYTRRPDFDYSTLEEKKPQKELDIQALLNLFRS